METKHRHKNNTKTTNTNCPLCPLNESADAEHIFERCTITTTHNNALKEQIRQRLAEKRVVQHIPARMDGLRVEQNTWRVVVEKNGEVTLRQRIRQSDGSRPKKEAEEKALKLLGLKQAHTVCIL